MSKLMIGLEGDYATKMCVFIIVFFKQRVKNKSLEDVVMLNVDTNTLESPFNDLSSLPSDVVSVARVFCGEHTCVFSAPGPLNHQELLSHFFCLK